MNKPLVTIVMPVYNVAPYIERALLSAIRQTYSNLEIILVDDCGKDDSIPIAERLIAQYDTNRIVRIIHHDHNRGLSAARNTGTKAARGEYVYYLDSDDEMTPDCLDKMVAIAIKYPKVDMVVGDFVTVREGTIQENVQLKGHDFSMFPIYSEDKEWIVFHMFNGGESTIPSTSWNKLMRFQYIKENKLSFIEGVIHEDEKMTFDCAECIQTLAFCFDITYIHYRTANSIMSSLTAMRSIRAWHKILLAALPKMKEPYINLKLASGMLDLTSKYLNLPKNDIRDIWKTKYVFWKIAVKASQFGEKKIMQTCLYLVFCPFRIARLTKMRKRLVSSLDLK